MERKILDNKTAAYLVITILITAMFIPFVGAKIETTINNKQNKDEHFQVGIDVNQNEIIMDKDAKGSNNNPKYTNQPLNRDNPGPPMPLGLGDPWWNTAWPYRKEITINHNRVDDNLIGFPVLVEIIDDNLSMKAQSNGDDIAFVDNSTGNQLHHEIELYNNTNGHLVAWVNVTSLSSTEDTVLYMYYGNSGSGNQEHIEGTWNDDFVLVQHLHETTGAHYDSTSYNNDGSPQGGVIQDCTGIINGADEFDGTDDYISISDADSLDLTESFTFEAWINADDWANPANSPLFDKAYDNVDRSIIIWALSGEIRTLLGTTDGSSWSVDVTTTSMDMYPNNWYYIVISWDKTDGPVNFYRNGSLIQSLDSKADDIAVNTQDLYIGADYTVDDTFDGIIDEARVSEIARNNSWIKASYHSMNNSLLTFGNEETFTDEPVFSNINPINGSIGVELNPVLQASISDAQNDNVDWWILSNASGQWKILENGSLSTGNGTVSTSNTSTMNSYNTVYWWSVNATDTFGTGNWTNETYHFTTQAAWLNYDWAYRKSHQIDGSTAGAQENYQIPITVHYESDMDSGEDVYVDGLCRKDFGDIRFTNAGGNELDYWMESSNIVEDLIQNYNSSHSNESYDYLEEMVTQIKKDPSEKGFFDTTNNRWIRSLSWNGSDWSGYSGHDWKYSMICQEGAMQYALNRNTGNLDEQITQEFNFMNSSVNPDGSVSGASGQYEYGVILSSFALGSVYFDGVNQTLANQCYNDTISVYGYVRGLWESPSTVSDYSMLLRGFSNTWKAFTHYGNTTKANEVKVIIENYAHTFITNQAGSGAWTGCGAVQQHEKRDMAIMLAYDATSNVSYLTAVRDNIDYILANLWDSPTGGVIWNPGNNEFYECHQIWFMISARLLYDRSDGLYDYMDEIIDAWLFLTDNNFAGIDNYVHNYENQGAFFSYRQLWRDGSYQTASFKGSYEIGVALWGLSLNYDLISQTGNASFWVEVPSIPADPGSATIYIYYGNSGATYPENDQLLMDNTFVNPDHFYGTSLNASKWVVRQGDVAVGNGNLVLTGTTGTRGLIDSLTSFSYPKAVYARLRWGQNTSNSHHFLSMRNVSSPSWDDRGGDTYGSGDKEVSYQTWKDAVSTTTSGISLVEPMEYHVYRLIWEDNKSTLFQGDTQLVQHTTNVTEVDQGLTYYEGDVAGETAYVDWVFVRNYCDPEPVHGDWGVVEVTSRPVVSDEDPSDGATNVDLTPVLSLTVMDYQGDLMDIVWYENTTGSFVQVSQNTSCINGTYYYVYSNASNYSTRYWWMVNVSDDVGNYNERVFSFTTGANDPPVLSNPFPSNGATGIPVGMVTLAITANDPEDDSMNITFRTNASGSWQTIDFNLSDFGGRFSQAYSFDEYTTRYWWSVNATDVGGGGWTNNTYSFTTEAQTTFNPFDEGWLYRKEITIDHSLVDADLLNFPVLVDNTSADVAAHAQSDGADILFMDDVGAANKLNHEIEFYNSSNGELVAWVNVTEVSSTVNTSFYMYYGNSGAVNQENPSGVWDSNYVLVQHLNETGTGTRFDSTAFSNDGTPSGYDGDEAVTGLIDGADDLDGGNDYVDLGDDASLRGMDEVTISYWTKLDSLQDNGAFLGWWSANTGNRKFLIRMTSSGAFQGYIEPGGNQIGGNFGTTLSTGVWTYLCMTWDGSTWRGYRDGSSLPTTYSGSGSISSSSEGTAKIGSDPYASEVDGIMDEFRISDVARSADWMNTSYNNQFDPVLFCSVGDEESPSPQDTSPPEISNVFDVPDPQEAGGFVNITCDVTDNVGIDTVKVNISGPGGFSPINSTMSEGSYYYNNSYSIVGNYTYFIWANDTSGNANTSPIYHFEIKRLYNISVNTSWNLISLPFNESIAKTNIIVRNNSIDYNWTTAVSEGIILNFLYNWTGTAYEHVDTLEPGYGYWSWAFYDCKLIFTSSAEDVENMTSISPGWKIVGLPYNQSLAKGDLIIHYNVTDYSWENATGSNNEEGEPLILRFIYGYNRTAQIYMLSDNFDPGHGYWMYAYYDCILKREAS